MSKHSMEPVRIGVVGLGNFGRQHALTLAGLAEANLVALVARRQASLDGLRDQLPGVPGWLDLEQAIVCGHSMGGVVAQLLALDHPNKVRKLILASSGSSHPGANGIPLAMCRDMVCMASKTTFVSIPLKRVGPKNSSRLIPI